MFCTHFLRSHVSWHVLAGVHLIVGPVPKITSRTTTDSATIAPEMIYWIFGMQQPDYAGVNETVNIGVSGVIVCIIRTI